VTSFLVAIELSHKIRIDPSMSAVSPLLVPSNLRLKRTKPEQCDIFSRNGTVRRRRFGGYINQLRMIFDGNVSNYTTTFMLSFLFTIHITYNVTTLSPMSGDSSAFKGA